MEIEKKIFDSRKIIQMLNSVLWSRNIVEKTKRTIFNSLIENVLLYGAEAWTIMSVNGKKKYCLQKWLSGDDRQVHSDWKEKLILK